MVRRQIRGVTNSDSVLFTIPKNLAEILDFKAGQFVDIDLIGKKMIISKAEEKIEEDISTEEKEN